MVLGSQLDIKLLRCAHRNACRILVGRTYGKGQLGRPRSRWEKDIKMNLQKIG
jgi:hypothetical protein